MKQGISSSEAKIRAFDWVVKTLAAGLKDPKNEIYDKTAKDIGAENAVSVRMVVVELATQIEQQKQLLAATSLINTRKPPKKAKRK